MQDEYRTTIDHAVPMYGVEIVANQIDVCRAGFLPKEVGNPIQLALLFLWCAALLFLLKDRKVGSSVLIWLIACGGWVGVCLLAYRAGWILRVLWFPLAATVLFVDIRGFTPMSENLDPPTVVEIINKYLTLTTACIMRYHGTLDKFVGDCTMAFWNAPLPQEDPVYLACCAAMDMVEGSKALGEELLQTYGLTVSFGVGVHYGSAVVGNIGAPQRMDYTAIGDTVNTSARLEANAPGGKVLISRVVADALGDRAKVSRWAAPSSLRARRRALRP